MWEFYVTHCITLNNVKFGCKRHLKQLQAKVKICYQSMDFTAPSSIMRNSNDENGSLVWLNE